MDVLIDNKNITDYGITCLDYTGALGFASERENERTWSDKSGVDKNLENRRYDTREFILKLIVKADNEDVAYDLVDAMIQDMFVRGAFVLSLRDSARSIRKAFLCERSGGLVPTINIRTQNSLYYFKLGLKELNPAAVKYQNTVVGNSTTILYDKGQPAVLYWGDGTREEVSNSGNYTKTDFASNGLVDVIIDIDKDSLTVEPLIAEFSASDVLVEKPFSVTFIDESLGTVEIWSWDFGDQSTSAEQNPVHEYTEEGVYTVTLTVFNNAQGSDSEIKVAYITVVPQELRINDTGDVFLINNAGAKLLKN